LPISIIVPLRGGAASFLSWWSFLNSSSETWPVRSFFVSAGFASAGFCSAGFCAARARTGRRASAARERVTFMIDSVMTWNGRRKPV
jgi:hypothetical protein